jgi:hypothetical protein
MLVSTTSHLCYPEYRDADLRSPEVGTIVANIPTALTGNPLGAVVAHSTVHVSAAVHQREGGSTQMLPPKIRRIDASQARALPGSTVISIFADAMSSTHQPS